MSKSEKILVLAVGELLWDIFPDDKRIGGAPANFAYYLKKIGENPVLISRVGQDSLGVQALTTCRSAGLINDSIQVDSIHPTGRVRVELDKKGVPNFEIEQDAAWDFLEEEDHLFSLVKNAAAVYFGTLAQRNEISRNTIQRLQAGTGPGCLKVLDLNLRSPYHNRQIIESSLEMADVLKLNLEELNIVSRLFSFSGTESERLKVLMGKFSLKVVAMTAGSEGSLIVAGGKEYRHPGYLVNVVDTVGAGDAFTAALVDGLIKEMDFDEIGKSANRLASFVCTRKGAWVNISDLVRPVC
ncbi:MAG: carbohydrate kinase [Candidatus Saccharicenans sp.]|nr:carbohydrate kinase [Candidatus Saccharicenans sp.]